MADISEVSTAIVNLISSAIYPSGTSGASAIGQVVKIYPGWPVGQKLDEDLKNGVVHVSVFPMQHDNVTFFEKSDRGWEVVSVNTDTGILQREARWQKREFRVTVWAGCFDSRDSAGAFIDSFMSGVTHINFTEGTIGNVTYHGSAQIDSAQKQGIYRRDFSFLVEYPTTQRKTAYVIKQVNPTITQGVSI